MSLANDSYEGLPTLVDSPEILNLAWNVDEREFLDRDLPALVGEVLRSEMVSGLPYIDSYFVQDPYGESHLMPAVERHFGMSAARLAVTCGAGVGSLLHALAALAGDDEVHIVGDVYPDLPHWANRRRPMSVRAADPTGAPPRGGVVLLDRPSPLSDAYDDLVQVRELCGWAARGGALVVADESYANYHPPNESAVALVADVENLVVLRGMSKAYWLGGLRLGYCVSSRPLAGRLRAAVPPMQVASLSLRIGAAVLALGDVTAGLRSRIVTAKADVTALVAARGLPPAESAGRYVPHLLFGPDTVAAGLPDRIAACGVQGKRQPFWSGRHGRIVDRYRMSVPLREDRLAELARRLHGSAVRPGDHRTGASQSDHRGFAISFDAPGSS